MRYGSGRPNSVDGRNGRTDERTDNAKTISLGLRQGIKINVIRVKGLEILGRVGTHIFFFILNSPFKMQKNYIFSRKPEKKFYVSPLNLGRVRITLNTAGIF